MTTKNTPHAYGTVAKTFHWLTALFIVSLIPLGLYTNNLAYQIKTATTMDQAMVNQTALLFSLHKTMGLAVFLVALLRILWALTNQKPRTLHPDRKLEHFAAETVHWLLYGSLVIVPLSGWIHHAATTGFAPIWWPFGQTLFFVPTDEAVAATFAGLHQIFSNVLIGAILLHVAGALKHHFIDRDDTLRRMWFVVTHPVETAVHHGARASVPAAAAIIVWLAALGAGAALGKFESHTTVTQAVELEEVASDWQVTEGTVAISIVQFANTVEGSFADWTASIIFDPMVENGEAGSVIATIAIGSLTLGSVTEQALAADFFDAGAFPTATYDAVITHRSDGYVAQGELKIKGQSLPVTLPLDLKVDGETAQLTTNTILNRLDYGIGQNMPDESSLKFAVEVEIELIAERASRS